MSGFNRRQFVQSSALAAGALAVAGEVRAAPSDQIRLCVMGVRGRGKSHIEDLIKAKDATIASICDVDRGAAESTAADIEKRTGKKPAIESDIRKVLESKEIDAITIATPNHWHSLATFWACQAGKDVYVEKPLSHNVWEGRKIVEAARKYGRIVQHGTQTRSSGAVRSAVEFMRAGKLGKLTAAVALCYKPRGSIGKRKEDTAVPAGVNYDLWLGPAAQQPIRRAKLHYDWHWFWDFGNGDIGNQGVHQMDVARWGLGKSELPGAAFSLGGRFGYSDDAETPNTQVSVLDYGDCKLFFEVRGLKTKGAEDDITIGNVFHGTEGMITIGGKNGVQCLMGKSREVVKIPSAGKAGPGGGHMGNFLAAMRSRKFEDLNADVQEGHLSSALCHLANISYRLAKPTKYDKKSETFCGDCCEDPRFAETIASTLKHMGDNGVVLEETTFNVGKPLKFDPKTERFPGDEAANALLTRQYRAPFAVSDTV